MWAVIQHVSYEGQGNIAHALRRARLGSVNLRPFQGDLLPRAADLSGLIVLGAPSGSADEETSKHLGAERQLISDAVGRGLPVLGVCFGAQLLAVALGGGVVKDGMLEVGMGAATLTAAGCADPSSVPTPRRSRSCIGIATATRCRQARCDWPPATDAPSGVSGRRQRLRTPIPRRDQQRTGGAHCRRVPDGSLESAAVARASAWGNTVLDRFLALQ